MSSCLDAIYFKNPRNIHVGSFSRQNSLSSLFLGDKECCCFWMGFWTKTAPLIPVTKKCQSLFEWATVFSPCCLLTHPSDEIIVCFQLKMPFSVVLWRGDRSGWGKMVQIWRGCFCYCLRLFWLRRQGITGFQGDVGETGGTGPKVCRKCCDDVEHIADSTSCYR